jgi:site-specific DNA-cytosine methylase
MENKDKIILDLCGGTGAWSKPYKDAGYDVRVITLPEWDILKFKDYPWDWENVYGILAAPPCTMFSMARTVAKTPRDLKGAMEVVNACLQIIAQCQYKGKRLQFWAMENPKARLRWFLGKPAMTFNPFEFGDAYRKPTDIWGNFNTNLKKNIVELDPLQDKQSRLNIQHLQPIPKDYIRDPNMSSRAIARSITHTGFAQAFFNANK